MNRETAYKVSRSVENWLKKHKDLSNETQQIVETAVQGTLTRLQTHIGTDLQAISRDEGRALADDLQRSLFELVNNNWYDNHRDDMLIVPEGTRFVHRQGDKVFVAVEEKPQVRSVNYSYDNGEIETHRIALPYMIFVFPMGAFTGGDGETRYKIDGARLAMSRQPLTSLHQRLLTPCLPNIDANNASTTDRLKICMGGDFKQNVNDGISDQVSNYISYFWNAPFGQDWQEGFLEMGRRDSRFETFRNWADETEKNSLFVLDAQVPYKDTLSFSEIIRVNLGREDNLNVPLQRIVAKAVDRLGGRVVAALKHADLLKDYNPKMASRAVYELMSQLVRDCVENVSDDFVVTEKEKYNEKKDSVEDGLAKMLADLEERLDDSEKKSEKAYW